MDNLSTSHNHYYGKSQYLNIHLHVAHLHLLCSQFIECESYMRYAERRLKQIIESQPPDPPKAKNPPFKPTKEWTREYQRKYRLTPAGRKQLHRSNLMALYRLTIEQYEDVYMQQGGCCAICRDKISRAYDPSVEKTARGPKRGQAYIDHNHACCPGRRTCGKCLRGLLCSRCNAGLGSFRDKPDLLMAAVKYLGCS